MAGHGKPGPEKGSEKAIEAGRRGGAAVREARGVDFFRAIGQKGGNATKEKYGPEFFSQIGQKGGESLKRQRGVDFFKAIARKGGSAGRGLTKATRVKKQAA